MSGAALNLDLVAVELRGPGLPGWAASRSILAGEQPYCATPLVLEPPAQLSPAERRRAVPSVRLALAVGAAAVAQSGYASDSLPAVFASSGADGETIEAILTSLTDPAREVSPTRFHNSVHNAPSGYWGVATQSQQPVTSVSCHDASFAAGLLEAAVQAVAHQRPILLVAYDLPYPGPLHAIRPVLASFGIALVVCPATSGRMLARLEITLTDRLLPATASGLDEALEQLRCGNPAARSLPLLSLLAQQRRGRVDLTLSQGALTVTVKPQ